MFGSDMTNSKSCQILFPYPILPHLAPTLAFLAAPTFRSGNMIKSNVALAEISFRGFYAHQILAEAYIFNCIIPRPKGRGY